MLKLYKESLKAADIDCYRMERIYECGRGPRTFLRAQVERILRELLFAHRDKFRDVKASSIVVMWERKTGMVWWLF